MNDDGIRSDIVDAIDEIRAPAGNVVNASMAIIRAGKADRRFSSLAATALAIMITVSLVVVLLAVGATRRSPTAPRLSANPPTNAAICRIAVRTDRGPGLISVPSGTYETAGPLPSGATTYDPATKRWVATDKQGVSPDGKLVALLDNLKGHNQTLRLESSDGRVLYTRDYVMRILGWAADGSLLVTTVPFPDRLLRISADGTATDWVVPATNFTIVWTFALGHFAWGVALPSPNEPPHKVIVRLDLTTREIVSWYAMVDGSFNDTGYGPILGLTADGWPIVPQLSKDPTAGVYELRDKNVATPVRVSGSLTATNFWPVDAVGSPGGIAVATQDGDLYWASKGSALMQVHLAKDLHVSSFGGNCQ
jgi:hypothetical protein